MVTLGGIQSIAKRWQEKWFRPWRLCTSLRVWAFWFQMQTNYWMPLPLLLPLRLPTQRQQSGLLVRASCLLFNPGIARGVFSNESGHRVAHPWLPCGCKTDSCVSKVLSLWQVPSSTIIICTMTGLALILTGAWQTDLSGAAMTLMHLLLVWMQNTLGLCWFLLV